MSRSTVVIAVLFLLTATMVADASFHGLGIVESFMQGFDSGRGIPDRQAAEYLREGVLTAGPGLTALEVTAGAGSIKVAGADTHEVRVSYWVRVLAAGREDASAYAGQVAVTLTAAGGRARLAVTEPELRPYPIGQVEVDLLVEVPRGLALELVCAGGVVIRGTGPTRLDVAGARLATVEDLTGDLVAKVTHGGLQASGISGSAAIEAYGGRIHLSGIGGDVEVMARVPGAIEVRDVGGGFTGRTLSGTLDVSGVSGPVFVESRLSHVSLRDIGGPADLATSGGSINFTGPVHDVWVKGQLGHVHLFLGAGAGYRVQAALLRGFVATDYPLDITRVESFTDEVKGTIGDGRAVLNVVLEGGSLEIRRVVE